MLLGAGQNVLSVAAQACRHSHLPSRRFHPASSFDYCVRPGHWQHVTLIWLHVSPGPLPASPDLGHHSLPALVLTFPVAAHVQAPIHTPTCAALQEFFFPKEDEVTRRQDQWVKGLEPPRPARGHTRKGSNLSVVSDGDSAALATTGPASNPSLSHPGSPEASGSRTAGGTASGTLVTSSSSGERTPALLNCAWIYAV